MSEPFNLRADVRIVLGHDLPRNFALHFERENKPLQIAMAEQLQADGTRDGNRTRTAFAEGF